MVLTRSGAGVEMTSVQNINVGDVVMKATSTDCDCWVPVGSIGTVSKLCTSSRSLWIRRNNSIGTQEWVDHYDAFTKIQ